MKTFNNFILERLKLTKDTKLQSYNYVYFIWPINSNYLLLKETHQNTKNPNQIDSVENPSGITAYICNIDFFNDNIKQKWHFNDGVNSSKIIEIPINDIRNVIEFWSTNDYASYTIDKLKEKYKEIN